MIQITVIRVDNLIVIIGWFRKEVYLMLRLIGFRVRSRCRGSVCVQDILLGLGWGRRKIMGFIGYKMIY